MMVSEWRPSDRQYCGGASLKAVGSWELLTGEERDAPHLDVGHGRVHYDVAHPGGP